jgi:hypothetical protein
VTESKDIQFRAEFFNILNHPNFWLPDSDISSPIFNTIQAAQPTIVRWKLRGSPRIRPGFLRMRMSGLDSESEEVFIVTGQCGGEGLHIAGLNTYL